MDGKVVFVKYGNFIRRIPIDRIIPAESYQDTSTEEADPDDIDNSERLADDEFTNVELLAQKDKEIENLKKKIQEKEKMVADISNKMKLDNIKDLKVPKLPKNYQKICFKVAGNPTLLRGKVINKHKPNSTYKDIVVVRMEDGTKQEFDFVKDVTEWSYDPDAIEEVLINESFVTTLTRAQVAGRPDVLDAIQQEIKKFEDFSAFKVVKDSGQYAIKTRWVFTDNEDESKGYRLKARLCIRGDTEENIC